jgi:hypothetical protein
MTRLRACWVTQAPVGWAVIPRGARDGCRARSPPGGRGGGRRRCRRGRSRPRGSREPVRRGTPRPSLGGGAPGAPSVACRALSPAGAEQEASAAVAATAAAPPSRARRGGGAASFRWTGCRSSGPPGVGKPRHGGPGRTSSRASDRPRCIDGAARSGSARRSAGSPGGRPLSRAGPWRMGRVPLPR